MKKGTGFILAVLLAVMLVPQAVYGANPADSRNIRVQAPVQSGASGRINITEAEVTIGIPSDGMVADFNAIIPWYADYYISDVQWYDENDQRYLVVGSGDKYMEGHSYTVSISLTADDGYQFAQDVSVNFNYGLQAETRRFANISDPSYCFMLLVRYTRRSARSRRPLHRRSPARCRSAMLKFRRMRTTTMPPCTGMTRRITGTWGKMRCSRPAISMRPILF